MPENQMMGGRTGLGTAGTTTMASTPMRTDGMAADAPAGRGLAGDQGESTNVSPEEQAQYDQFVNKAFQVIYDQRALPKVLGMLGGHGDPKEGLARTAAAVVVRVEDAAAKAGTKVEPAVLYQGGIEILNDLANLADQAGVHKFTDDEIEGAVFRALDLYREARKGELDKGAIDQEFGQIVAANQQGTLDQMFPALKDAPMADKKGAM